MSDNRSSSPEDTPAPGSRADVPSEDQAPLSPDDADPQVAAGRIGPESLVDAVHSDDDLDDGPDDGPGDGPGDLRGDLEQANDRLLRARAELENYRKRSQRELHEQRQYANMGLVRDLLPVIDNMQRAMEAADAAADGDAAAGLLDGVKMVADQLLEVLERHHCRPIDAQDRPFDPNLHEAVMQQPSAEQPPGTVMQVVQAGYRLHDRVVRPSQVIVSAAPNE